MPTRDELRAVGTVLTGDVRTLTDHDLASGAGALGMAMDRHPDVFCDQLERDRLAEMLAEIDRRGWRAQFDDVDRQARKFLAGFEA